MFKKKWIKDKKIILYMDINIILCHWNKIGYVQIFRLTDLSDILMILRSLEFVLDRIVCILCLSGPLMLSDNVQYDCLPSLIKRWSFGAILQIVIQNPGEVHCWKNLKIWLDSYWERRVKNHFPFKHPPSVFLSPRSRAYCADSVFIMDQSQGYYLPTHSN